MYGWCTACPQSPLVQHATHMLARAQARMAMRHSGTSSLTIGQQQQQHRKGKRGREEEEEGEEAEEAAAVKGLQKQLLKQAKQQKGELGGIY